MRRIWGLTRQLSTYNTKVAIIGAGTGGLGVCSQLIRRKIALPNDIVVIDPSAYHCYYGYATMIVGGLLGNTDKDVARYSNLLARPTNNILPKNVSRIKSSAVRFIPEENRIYAENGDVVNYQTLLLSPGLKCNYEAIKGAKEAINDMQCNVGSMFYGESGALKMNKIRLSITKGKLIVSNTAITGKCWGAPLKTCFLIEDYLRKAKKREENEIHFYSATNWLYPIPEYAAKLKELTDRKGIIVHYNHSLKEINKEKMTALFEASENKTQKVVEVKFDYMHFAPAFTPCENIKNSPFMGQDGFISVDKKTLQHAKYKNVFAIGDILNLPVSKTASALSVQVPVAVHNIGQYLKNKPLTAEYSGYSACPIFTGGNRMLFAEGLFREQYKSFMVPNTTLKWFYYFFSRYIMPRFYWWFLPKGMWYGKRFIFPPKFK